MKDYWGCDRVIYEYNEGGKGMFKNFMVLLTTVMTCFSLSNVGSLETNISNNQVDTTSKKQEEVVNTWNCPSGNKDCINENYHATGHGNENTAIWSCPNGNVDCTSDTYHTQGHCYQQDRQTTSTVNQDASGWSCPDGNMNCISNGYHNQGHCSTTSENQGHHRGSRHHNNNHH